MDAKKQSYVRDSFSGTPKIFTITLQSHEPKTAQTKKDTNQKGHEPKSGYLWKIAIFQPKYNSFVLGN